MNIAKISKSNGKSAVNSSAYQRREKFKNHRTNETYDYLNYKKNEKTFSKVLLPNNAPTEWENAEKLWNEVEKIEKNSNALFARRVIVALPLELSAEENISLVESYCKDTFVSKGMACDYSIHFDDGNPHCHILLTTRPIEKNGNWGTKEKKVYKLDESGNKIPLLDEDGNQKVAKDGRKLWKRERVERFYPNNKIAEEWRVKWANTCNKWLTIENQIDNRSYKRQGLDIEPQIHTGYSHIRQVINAEIIKSRNIINTLLDKIKALKKEIANEDKGKISIYSRKNSKGYVIEIDKHREDLNYRELKDLNSCLEFSRDKTYLYNSKRGSIKMEFEKKDNKCEIKIHSFNNNLQKVEIINKIVELQEIIRIKKVIEKEIERQDKIIEKAKEKLKKHEEPEVNFDDIKTYYDPHFNDNRHKSDELDRGR